MSLNRTGRRLLTVRHRLTVTLTAGQRINRKITVFGRRKVTFTSPRKRKRHH